MHVCTYIHMYIHMHTYMYMCVYVCVWVFVCVCVCVHFCVCTYIHHTHRHSLYINSFIHTQHTQAHFGSEI
jgi:hypothetical protein